MSTQHPEALRLRDLANTICNNQSLPLDVRQLAFVLAAGFVEQHNRITELEAQLEAVGAGGVGPLIACAGFSSADMATAAAQGFRDGVASVNAVGEPVANNRPSLEEVFRRLSDRAYCNYIEQIGRDACLGWEHKAAHGKFGEAELKGHTIAGEMLGRHKAFAEAANALRGSDAPLTYPSPPAGMVGGWMPIETAPKNGTDILGYAEEGGALVLYWDSMTGEMDHWSDGMSVRFWKPTHWMHLPAAPGPADGDSNELC